MDTATRRRGKIQTESLLEIVSRIKVRSFRDRTIRYLDAEGDRWIVFADICKALDYKNPNHESKKIDPEEKRKLDIGLKNTLAVCINRRGLLRFALFANKPEASEFLSWATREIFSNWNDEPTRCGENPAATEKDEILRMVRSLTTDQKKAFASYLHYLTAKG